MYESPIPWCTAATPPVLSLSPDRGRTGHSAVGSTNPHCLPQPHPSKVKGEAADLCLWASLAGVTLVHACELWSPAAQITHYQISGEVSGRFSASLVNWGGGGGSFPSCAPSLPNTSAPPPGSSLVAELNERKYASQHKIWTPAINEQRDFNAHIWPCRILAYRAMIGVRLRGETQNYCNMRQG